MIDKSKIDIGGARLPDERGAGAVPVVQGGGFERRFYDITTGNLLPLEFIRDRIKSTFNKVRKMSVEMVFDCYFLEKNWQLYGEKAGYQEWADENLPISRSYRFDLRKSVDLLIENGGEKPWNEMVQDAMVHFDQIGIGTLKLVAQVDDPAQKKEILADLKAGKKVKKEAILSENKKEKAQKTEEKIRPVSPDDSFRRGTFVVYAGETLEIYAVDFWNESLKVEINGKAEWVNMSACAWVKE